MVNEKSFKTKAIGAHTIKLFTVVIYCVMSVVLTTVSHFYPNPNLIFTSRVRAYRSGAPYRTPL